MRCEAHPGSDAIGQCSRCSRALCAECAVRPDGALHCKSCVDSATRPAPPTAAAVVPAAPVPAYYPPPPSPYARVDPKPRGRPAAWPFAVGSAGALGGGITMMLSAPFGGLGFSGLLYADSYGYQYYVLPLVLALVMASFQTLYAVGLYGFWRNYGPSMSLGGAIAVVAGSWVSATVFVISALSMPPPCIDYCPDPAPSYYYYGFLTALYSVPIGAGLIVGAIGLHAAGPFHADPRSTKNAALLMGIGGLLLSVACLAFIGWVTAGVAELVSVMLFRTAPVPAAPGMVKPAAVASASSSSANPAAK